MAGLCLSVGLMRTSGRRRIDEGKEGEEKTKDGYVGGRRGREKDEAGWKRTKEKGIET